MPWLLRPASVLMLAALTACAGDGRPFSGQRIMNGLERSGVQLPDESGRSGRTQAGAARPLPTSGPLALADLLAAAEAASPELGAARSEAGIAAGRAWQASLYPNPRVDLAVEDVSWRDGASGSKTTVGVSQPVIVGGRRGAAIAVAEAERDARLAEVEVKRRALFGEVAALHARLLAVRDQERLYTELRVMVEATLAAATMRLEAKAAPENDVIRPRVELHRVGAALLRLEEERRSVARQLALRVGEESLDAARIADALPTSSEPLDVAALEALVRSRHPELLAADREIEAAAARAELVKAARTPDLDVRVAAGYRGERDDGIVEVGAGVTIPVWDQGQGDGLSARFGLMHARQRRAAAERALLGRLAEAVGAFESARVQLAAVREKLVPDAQRAFDQVGAAYRGGRATFLDLLDAQRTTAEARIMLSELAGETARAGASLVQIVGPEAFAAATPRPGPGSSTGASDGTQRPQGEEVER